LAVALLIPARHLVLLTGRIAGVGNAENSGSTIQQINLSLVKL